jgi:hypothetical protein
MARKTFTPPTTESRNNALAWKRLESRALSR